jgi:hypothetical protein
VTHEIKKVCDAAPAAAARQSAISNSRPKKSPHQQNDLCSEADFDLRRGSTPLLANLRLLSLQLPDLCCASILLTLTKTALGFLA